MPYGHRGFVAGKQARTPRVIAGKMDQPTILLKSSNGALRSLRQMTTKATNE
jgi:hypothetical protein